MTSAQHNFLKNENRGFLSLEKRSKRDEFGIGGRGRDKGVEFWTLGE
jgi:hypothetical protein